jgi:hypothetical protein
MDENRFCRIQPMTPVVEIGAGSRGASSVLMWNISDFAMILLSLPFHERHALVVPVHEGRCDQAER